MTAQEINALLEKQRAFYSMNKILIVRRVGISDASVDEQEYPVDYVSKQGFLSSLVDDDHFISVRLKSVNNE